MPILPNQSWKEIFKGWFGILIFFIWLTIPLGLFRNENYWSGILYLIASVWCFFYLADKDNPQ